MPLQIHLIFKGNDCCTLTACPKKPFPRTSPCMRSEGLKMRWVRSPESTRRDSDRTMSLFWDISDSAPGDSGHLSMLQLRLENTGKLVKYNCWCFRRESTVCTYKMCLVRVPVLPLLCVAKGLILICSLSWSGFGSSSRLGSLWAEPSFSGPSVELLWSRGWFEPGWSSGDCGLCSMVSCSGLVVSWITQFICRKGHGLIRHISPSLVIAPLSYDSYLLRCNVPDRNTINLQYPVPSVHREKRVTTEDSWVQPVRRLEVWCSFKLRVRQLETHPETLTRGPVSWLRSVVIVRPRWPPAQGGKDTSATMCGLLVSVGSDLWEDTTTPWYRQLPLQEWDS